MNYAMYGDTLYQEVVILVEGISRQPEVENKIRTTFMLGIVFIETAIIYALLVVILIIFVL